jgi:hypothetical protein
MRVSDARAVMLGEVYRALGIVETRDEGRPLPRRIAKTIKM